MSEHPNPEPTQPGDAAGLGADQATAAPGRPTPPEQRPSDEATADIEERRETPRASERDAGRPPSDAPSY
jgi:hypothetical protein